MAAPRGNQNARKGKDWETALRKALARYEDVNVPKGQALLKIAEGCVAQALAGDKDARIEIANRLDGKPAQPVDGDGDGGAIRTITEIVIRAVDPS